MNQYVRVKCVERNQNTFSVILGKKEYFKRLYMETKEGIRIIFGYFMKATKELGSKQKFVSLNITKRYSTLSYWTKSPYSPCVFQPL